MRSNCLANRILDYLNTRTQHTSTVAFSAREIATQFDVPEPSVRRTLQRLRADKWNISYALSGDYVYRTPASTQAPTSVTV